MHDEAKFWFQNATDLDPALQVTRHMAAQPHAAPPRKTAKKRMQMPAWAEQFSALNLPAVGVGLAVVVVVFIVLIIMTGSGRSKNQGPTPPPTPTDAASRSLGGTTGNYATNPSARPPTTAPVPAPTAPSAPAQSNVRTAAEVNIREVLSSSKTVRDAGAQVDDVIADPRAGLAVVTISLSSKQTPSRLGVLNAAAAIAAAAFVANQQVKFATVRCLVSYGSEAGTQMVFVGDVARPSDDGLGGAITEQQLKGKFTNPWWNPVVK